MNNDFLNDFMGDNLKTSSEMSEFKCNSCSSSFIAKNKLSKCLFCGSENLIESQDTRDYDNTYIIQFMKNREDAIKDYKKKVIFNPLIPMIFKNKKTINSCEKIYLDSSLCDLHISGTTKFIGIDNVSKNNQDKYEVMNTVNFDYNNVLVSSNSKIDENLFLEICDYNYSALRGFDFNFFNDSVILIGDLVEQEVNTKVSNALVKTTLNVIKNNVKHSTKKLGQNALQLDNFKKRRVLIPIYLISVKYHDKNYLYMMNGENGKSTMNVTFGKLELVITSLLIFGIIFLIAFLVAFFL